MDLCQICVFIDDLANPAAGTGWVEAGDVDMADADGASGGVRGGGARTAGRRRGRSTDRDGSEARDSQDGDGDRKPPELQDGGVTGASLRRAADVPCACTRLCVHVAVRVRACVVGTHVHAHGHAWT